MFSNISLSLLFTWNCNLLFHCWIMAGWKKTLAYIILLTTYTFAERAKQKTYVPVLNCTGFKRDADFIKPSANKWISWSPEEQKQVQEDVWFLSKCSFAPAGNATSSLGYGESALLLMKKVMKNSLVTFCAESMC